MTVETLRSELLKLPVPEKRKIAIDLLESIEESDDDHLELSPEFIAELDRISKDIDEHPEQLVSFEDAERQLFAELRK